jgi:hypothetical protein
MRVRQLGRTVFASAVVLLGAGVATLAPATAHARRRPRPSSDAAPVAVAQRFARPVGPECMYRAWVRGTVTPAAPNDPRRIEQRPRLRVAAEVRCRDGSRDSVHGRLNDEPRSRDEIARGVATWSRVESRSEGRVCAYAPTFEWDGRRLALASLATECRNVSPTARGGGPTPQEYQRRQRLQRALDREWNRNSAYGVDPDRVEHFRGP